MGCKSMQYPPLCPSFDLILLTHSPRFRWVELQLSLFLDRKRPFRYPKDVENSLKRLETVSVAGHSELNKVYNEILDRNTSAGRLDRQHAQAAYSIILFAFRSMTFE